MRLRTLQRRAEVTFGFILLTLLSIAFTAIRTIVFDRNVNAMAYEKIQNGMTEKEVAALLMKDPTPWPAKGADIQVVRSTWRSFERDSLWMEGKCKIWFGDCVAIIVYFDNDRRVSDKDIQRAISPHDRLEWECRQYSKRLLLGRD